VWPKSCGHVKGKKVIPRDEAVARVRAACDARCILHTAYCNLGPSFHERSQWRLPILRHSMPGHAGNIVRLPQDCHQHTDFLSLAIFLREHRLAGMHS
jgi:hypothetical protein